MNIMTKLKNLIKAGKIDNTIDLKRVTIETLGKKQSAYLAKPYGIEIDPPENGILCILLSESGNENSMVAIPISNDLINTKIIFKDNQKIIFAIGNKIGGDFMARFNELKSGFDQLKSDFNAFLTHIHAAVTPGIGVSGPPTPPVIPSTASIDTAKINEIEVPEL